MSEARYRTPSNVAHVDGADYNINDALHLTILPAGDSVALSGTARIIWLVAIEGGPVVPRIAELLRQPEEAIAKDVASFLDTLVGRGLLVKLEQATNQDPFDNA